MEIGLGNPGGFRGLEFRVSWIYRVEDVGFIGMRRSPTALCK